MKDSLDSGLHFAPVLATLEAKRDANLEREYFKTTAEKKKM